MSKQAILDAIKNHDTIIIHRHIRPDPDAYGSQAGLARLIQATFPKKMVYVTGEGEPSLDFLITMDEVPDETFHGALNIVCDTANQARIDDQRYNQGELLIKIDHHPEVDNYGDIQWVDTSASSTSEMIFQFYLEFADEGLKMNDEAARLLYAGIVGDTGRFLYPSTTKQTLSYAAELVNYNFDRPILYNEMYKTPLHVAKLKGYVLQNFTVHEAGCSTIRLDRATLEKFEVTPSETSQLVGLLGDIEGMLAWAFFVEEEDTIRVRLRSKGPVINGIAANHKGGGHPLASGATASSWEETDEIAEELREKCLEYKKEQAE
ncbi:phosphoesterase RecJ domain-containing protein [Halobacillus karajensis]|uniref:Bifunctional oligoribonuclease and PAP phosphatase NrnA n=1 Tax=Halobacillus karajensis TaxID=195088 RepID=A0A024P6I1_9BACI|nr:bifunctional oligoribonuclease/PAP phosphatase NrnA [Halobacillus karajensis]CDQ18291.1 Bifunctional oligoribonuclease and PAP phosphatase NrnA [Halobacillus karajensis]CDQ24644.1 Bifunctional oligoribonuclease and PAP phosphatase NrnA [Halobacillus karajensis]CDQ29109.1 Bifunctional oligoribonuclease and PAP phosphatase NrnA [Halobacillus karajensis]SEI06173.1 phosphoesterase RecJ domain-containing protein [Halobacillus karajensis]